MKKVILTLGVIASFVACNSTTEQQTPTTDSTAVVTPETTAVAPTGADSVVVDSAKVEVVK
jgi:hypothetical protein